MGGGGGNNHKKTTRKRKKKKISRANRNHVLIAFLFVPGLTGSQRPHCGTPQSSPPHKPGAIQVVKA